MAKQKIKRQDKSKIKKRRNFNLIVLFVLAIFFSISVTEIAYFLYKIQYVKVFNTKFEVSNVVGFALGKQEFDFGMVPKGGNVARYIDVNNEGNRTLLIEILTAGNIKNFVFYENYIQIHPGESRRIIFTVVVPEGTKEAEYAGKIFLIFKRT